MTALGDMKKDLDPDTMEKELRLAFPPPLEARIEYFDHFGAR